MKKTLFLSGLALAAFAIPALASSSHDLFKPQTVSFQYYMPSGNAWGDMNTEKLTYNSDGSVATMEETGQKTIYSYNADGNLIRKEVVNVYNGADKPVTVTEYEYDPVVKDFVISETEYFYEGKAEPLYTVGNGTEITRNDSGKIIKVRTYNVSNGSRNYDDEQMTVEYGADGTAVKVTIEELEEKNGLTVTTVEEQWSDIVWDTTDGQILSMEFDDPNSDMYFSSNRVASATVTSAELPEPAIFTCTYDGDSYHSLLMMGSERIHEITFDCIEKFAPREEFDECYSYTADVYEVEFDKDAGQYYIESRVSRKEANTANEYGFCLLNEETTTYHKSSGDQTTSETEKTVVTYDDKAGYPIQAAKWKKDDSDKDFVPVSMYFFSDYVNVDPAAVSSIQPDGNDAHAEYFNLEGVRVSDPSSGIFIRRRGNTVEKVYVK